MNILITGCNGQLGSEIREISKNSLEHKFFFYDLPELDITDIKNIIPIVHSNSIDAIINCAAYTAVDNAEDNEEIVNKVNAIGVKNLVDVCEERSLKLIHISTDYVFNGTQYTPYCESDPVSPIGVYGRTKYSGEQAVINSDSDSIVIRTSWLYSSFGNNFVKTMIRLGEERDTLGVIFDQVGTPTYAADLAQTCLAILDSSNRIVSKGKTYHYSNEGVASWYDFTKAIHELAGIRCNVNPIGTDQYPTKATRPHYSVLNKSKIKADFGIEIPYWRDSLKRCISKLNS